MTVYLDTHVAAFLHAGDSALLSPTAVHLLESAGSLRISPIVVLELQYLFEIARIAYSGDEIAGFLRSGCAGRGIPPDPRQEYSG